MGAEDEGGTRIVNLDHGFFVARMPVTNAEYARFVEATGHESPTHWRGKVPPGDLRDHPVVYVNLDDAVAYCRWLIGQLQTSGLRQPETLTVRLPTEEEWEKAARGIDGRIYPWGDGFDVARCNSGEDDIDTTTPVGRYSPQGDSPCGCADIAGNVWEWTGTEHESSKDVGRSVWVLRGGAFSINVRRVRCAYRNWDVPYFRVRGGGFRVVASSVHR
jgi:formylglycine-generating enzyme required for sulfatase activity